MLWMSHELITQAGWISGLKYGWELIYYSDTAGGGCPRNEPSSFVILTKQEQPIEGEAPRWLQPPSSPFAVFLYCVLRSDALDR